MAAATKTLSTLTDPRERLIYRAGLFVLFVGALAASIAVAFHVARGGPRTLDLVVPGGFALVNLALAAWVFGYPSRVGHAIWIGAAAGFVTINDRFGHPAGDQVLRQVARRCEGVLRRGDLFARWGGEEFLVLVRGASGDGVLHVAEDLRHAISATAIESAGTVTASFGVARFDPRDTVESWLQRADAALYRAKNEGRDRVVSA